jgi:hypothetical protein
LAIVDSSALYASLDRRDADHERCAAVLRRPDLRLVVPMLVIAEVAYLADSRLGPAVEAAFLRGLGELDVEAALVEEWPWIADMVDRYADLRLGTTDASIAVLADRLETDVVITLDRRHFGAIRSPAGRTFRLLPDEPAVHEQPATYSGGGG